MSMGQRKKPAGRGRVVVLAVVVVVVFATLAAGFWIGFHVPSAGSAVSVFDQPVSAGSGPPIAANNLAQVHPEWAHTFAPEAPTRMVVAHGIVYMLVLQPVPNYYVVAVQNGKTVWRFQLQPSKGDLYPPTLRMGGDTLYVATTITIYALNPLNGRPLWQNYPQTPMRFNNPAESLVYVDGTLCYSTNQRVYALDAATGQPRWSYQFTNDPTSAYAPFFPLLVAGDGAVYLALVTSPYVAGPALTALDSQTGRVLWQIQETGANRSLMLDPLALMGGMLIRRMPDHVSALDPKTGTTLWTVPMSPPGSHGASSTASDAHRVYVAAADHIQALDLATGRPIWSSGKLDGIRMMLGPVVSNGVVYLATMTPFAPFGHPLFMPVRTPHWLYAFDAATGRELGLLQDNDSTFELIFLQADDTHLYVLGTRSFAGADDSARGMPELYALGV